MCPMEVEGVLRTVSALDFESKKLALTVFSDDMLIEELASRLERGRRVKDTLTSLYEEMNGIEKEY